MKPGVTPLAEYIRDTLNAQKTDRTKQVDPDLQQRLRVYFRRNGKSGKTAASRFVALEVIYACKYLKLNFFVLFFGLFVILTENKFVILSRNYRNLSW
jgi:hypothetical protein